MKDYKVIIETISSVNVKAETRQEAEKLVMEELSSKSNIVSKQVLSVCRVKQCPKDNDTEQ